MASKIYYYNNIFLSRAVATTTVGFIRKAIRKAPMTGSEPPPPPSPLDSLVI
jgi:hypothetical protein